MTEEKKADVLREAREHLTHVFAQAVREGDGCLPESDETLNEANRRVIRAMFDTHGEAWLGYINLHGGDRGNPEKAMWKWDGSTIYTFGCSFVLPKFDEELLRLIMERDGAQYKTTDADVSRIDAIMDRIEIAGGVHLMWT